MPRTSQYIVIRVKTRIVCRGTRFPGAPEIPNPKCNRKNADAGACWS